MKRPGFSNAMKSKSKLWTYEQYERSVNLYFEYKNDNVDANIKIAQLVIISYIKCNNDMR